MAVDQKHDIADLQAVWQRARDGLAGIRTQIGEIESHLQDANQRLSDLDVQEQELVVQVESAEQANEEAETVLRQKRTSALISKDTSLEAQTAAAATSALDNLEKLRKHLAQMQEQRGKKEKHIASTRRALREEIAKHEQVLQDLHAQEGELEIVEQARNSELGQAVFDQFMSELAAATEAEENLLSALAECRAERHIIEGSLSARLSFWPKLLRQAEARLAAQEPVEPPVTERVIRALMKYLQVVSQEGHNIKTTSFTNRPRVLQLLAVSDAYLARIIGKPENAEDHLVQLQRYLEEFQNDERRERERQALRNNW